MLQDFDVPGEITAAAMAGKESMENCPNHGVIKSTSLIMMCTTDWEPV